MKQRIQHSPTLKTIKMVEETINKSKNTTIKISEIKRKLPKKVNHNTLIQILEYLEESNKIYVGIKGITWIENKNPKFRALLNNSIKFKDLT